MINRSIAGLLMTISAALSGCVHHQPAPVASGPTSFVVGNPYQSHGEWLYPRNFDNYDTTGLATVIGDDHPALNTDGETYDPAALAAASPVLQLPAIVTVTNLVNGYAMDVRVNDRGPDNPGRILAVTPEVARRLGFPSGGVVEVEVALKTQDTAAIDGALGQGPKLSAAPVAGIQAQSLAAPGSGQTNGTAQNLDPAADADTSAAPAALSGRVTIYPPSPGPLYVQVPGFGRLRDAQKTMQEDLYGFPAHVIPIFGGDRTLYAVNAGPYHSIADADTALAQMLARGLTDPQIIVH